MCFHLLWIHENVENYKGRGKQCNTTLPIWVSPHLHKLLVVLILHHLKWNKNNHPILFDYFWFNSKFEKYHYFHKKMLVNFIYFLSDLNITSVMFVKNTIPWWKSGFSVILSCFLTLHVPGQEFFRAGVFSWNFGTLMNIHLQHKKERSYKEKYPFFSPGNS